MPGIQLYISLLSLKDYSNELHIVIRHLGMAFWPLGSISTRTRRQSAVSPCFYLSCRMGEREVGHKALEKSELTVASTSD